MALMRFMALYPVCAYHDITNIFTIQHLKSMGRYATAFRLYNKLKHFNKVDIDIVLTISADKDSIPSNAKFVTDYIGLTRCYERRMSYTNIEFTMIFEINISCCRRLESQY